MPNFFESNAPALSGAAQGLSGAIGNLRQAAQDERARPALEARSNLEIAMSQDAMRKLQEQQKEDARRRQPINLTDLTREKPMLQHLLKYSPAVMEGKDLSTKTDLTVGDYEDFQKGLYNNPKLWKQGIEEASRAVVPLDDKYGNTILTVQKEIQELQTQKDNLVDMRQAEKIDNELNKKNEELSKLVAARKPLAEKRAQTTQYLSAIEDLVNMKDLEKASAEQKQIAAYLKEQGKPWGLAAVEEYEAAKKAAKATEEKSDHYTIKNSAGVTKSIRLKSGESIPAGWQIVSGAMQENERDNLRFDTLVGKSGSDQTIRQFRNIQGIQPRVLRAYDNYKKDGDAFVLDDALLYALNKMNDPDSVVMIGEYMRTAGLQSWWNSIKGNIGAITHDQAKIAPEFREKLYRAVTSSIYDNAKRYDQRISYYRKRAKYYSSDRELIKDAFPLSSEIDGSVPASRDDMSQFWK